MKITKNYFAISLAGLLVFSGFTVFFTRLDPMHFFPKLPETINNARINLPSTSKINEIYNPTNIVNEHQTNFYTKSNLESVKFQIMQQDWGQDLATTPAFDKESIFALKNSGHIKCYSKESKQLNWQYQIIFPTKDHKFSTVSLHGKYLMVTVQNMLFVFDKTNGDEVMLKIVEAPITGSPSLNANGILHLQTSDIYYQFDINHKRELQRKYGSHTNIVQQGTITPILYNAGALTTHIDNKITYNSSDITKIVEGVREDISLPPIISEMEIVNASLSLKLRSISCQPLLSKDKLFVVLAHKKIVKYDLKNQSLAWEMQIPGVTKIFKVKDIIFALGYANQIIAIDGNTGKTLWIKNLPYKTSNAFLTPFVANSKIFICSKIHKSITLVSAQDGSTEKQIKLPKLPASAQILSIVPVEDELILFTSKKAIKLI